MFNVLTPEHPRWNEFRKRLTGRLSATPCNPELDRPVAKSILIEMAGIDAASTLEYFDAQGGFCDCEILMNVEQ